MALFGQIDIYLFDQILRRRLTPGMKVLDAGCGAGRNLAYLFRAGYDVSGADEDQAAIAAVREMAARLAPGLPAENFRVEAVEALSFPDACAEAVISSAVAWLHRQPRAKRRHDSTKWSCRAASLGDRARTCSRNRS